MKKIVLTLITLFSLSVAFGQFTSGFENSDGWINHSSGNWTETANAGNWIGHGIYANAQKTHSGARKIGLNTQGDWLELPPVNNPGILTFWTRLSSIGSASSNKLQIQRYDGSSWINVGSEITQSNTTYTQQSITINFTGIAVKIRIYRTADQRSHYIDDLEITIISSNATDSDAVAPTTQISGTTINSIADTPAEAVDVFKIEIQDSGLVDALATKVTHIRIKPHTTNAADWTDFIQGFKIIDQYNTTITPSAVIIDDTFIDFTFNTGDIDVNNGTSLDLTFSVYLNTSNILDNKILSFMVDADDHGFTADGSGSAFINPFPNGDFNSNDFIVNVVATELRITQQPTDVLVNTIMTPNVTVYYSDENGNRDRDFDGLGSTATLSATGATLAGTTTVAGTPIQGIMPFNDIEFTTFGTGVTLTIIDSGSVTAITSNPFTVFGAPVCNATTGITIASQDFEDTPATPTLTYSQTSVDPSSGQGTNPVADTFSGGLKSVKVNDASGTIDFDGIDTSKYENIEFSIRLASFAGTPGNGCDGGDFVLIKIKDGSSPFSKEIKVKGKTNNQWSFTSGTGIASVAYDGDNTEAVFQPTTNGTVTTEGYSTLKVTNLPASSNLQITIKIKNDSANEYWMLDDAILKGDQKDFTTWHNPSKTWSNGAPNATTKAFFDTSYNMTVGGSTASITACECEVKSGKTITVKQNKFLKIGNDIINNGTIFVKNKGSLIQVNNNQVTGTGDYKIEKTTPSYVDYDYTYWSSPVDNETIGSVLAANNANKIYGFTTSNFSDTDDDAFDDNNDDWNVVPGTTVMSAGLGYIAMGEGSTFPLPNPLVFTSHTQTVTFDGGKVNNGDIDVPVTLDAYNASSGTGHDSFNTNTNLIGNPYPSAIDIREFSSQIYHATNNPTGILEGTFYFWTHDDPIGSGLNTGPDLYNFSNDDYSIASVDNSGVFSATASANAVDSGAITVNKYVASGQGFFANVTGNGTVKFTNQMRVEDENTHFLRSANNNQLDRIWLNLKNSDQNVFRQILVGFHDGATDGFINGQDGPRMANGNNTDFYSIIPNESNRFAIQNLGTFNDTKTIDLGLEIIEDGDYTISIDHLEGTFQNGQNVYVEDLVTNTIHNLTNGAYLFNISIGDSINNRFVLRFTTNVASTNENKVSANLIISQKGDYFTLSTSNNSVIKSIHIYNMLGQELGNYNTNNSSVQIPANKYHSGTILFIKTTLEDGSILTKKVIK